MFETQDNYDRTVEVANLNAKNFRWLDGEMDLPHSSKDADKRWFYFNCKHLVSDIFLNVSASL